MSKISKIQEQIENLQEQLRDIQSECNHPKSAIYKKHGANTGGYDGPSFDTYWTDFHCGLCDKKWTEDGSK